MSDVSRSELTSSGRGVAKMGFEGEAGGSYVRSMKMVLKGRYPSEASSELPLTWVFALFARTLSTIAVRESLSLMDMRIVEMLTPVERCTDDFGARESPSRCW